ncbi:hypothetical protein ABBQ38_000057 [Trebouxia sp. C0009 RCD-2024]
MSGSMIGCPSANKTLCLSARKFPILIKRALRASSLSTSYKKAVHNVETADTSTPHRLALAVTVAPLLIPLQAVCQEQTVLEQAGSVSPEVVGLVSSTLAIPVVFGAVSLIQQARQAKEDKDLRLKAINTHNTFLTQEEEELDPAEQLSNSSSNSSEAATSSAKDNANSADRPYTATPAMLDDPEGPEPVVPGAPDVGSSRARAPEQEASKLPPQTAVLDRPERPEPDTAFSVGDLTTHTDVEALLFQPQAVALCEEDAARINTTNGPRDSMRSSSPKQQFDGQVCVISQVSDMAAEYAAKLALLHEESAARAKGDLRKRRQRSLMLADLQAQAQMATPASPANIPEQQTQNTVIKFFSTVWAHIIVFLRYLVLRVQTFMGASDQSADMSNSAQYSST